MHGMIQSRLILSDRNQIGYLSAVERKQTGNVLGNVKVLYPVKDVGQVDTVIYQ